MFSLQLLLASEKYIPVVEDSLTRVVTLMDVGTTAEIEK